VPKWSVNIGVNYEHPLGAIFSDFGPGWEAPVTGFGYLNLAWQDKTQLTDPNSILQYWQPAYSIVNGGVGLRTSDERYSVAIWSKNIFDERPVFSWTPGDPSNPATLGLPVRPRIFGGTLLVKLE
jgi:iron complex outermembrane receptor protein